MMALKSATFDPSPQISLFFNLEKMEIDGNWFKMTCTSRCNWGEGEGARGLMYQYDCHFFNEQYLYSTKRKLLHMIVSIYQTITTVMSERSVKDTQKIRTDLHRDQNN